MICSTHFARRFFANQNQMNKSSNRANSAKDKASETLAKRITGVIYATIATPYYMYHIQRIAKRNPEGYTVDKKRKAISDGYSIAVKETQDSHGIRGLMRTTYHSLRHGLNFGGWLDTATGRYYYDSVVIEYDEDTAIAKGLKNEQIAIYNLTDGKEIRLTA